MGGRLSGDFEEKIRTPVAEASVQGKRHLLKRERCIVQGVCFSEGGHPYLTMGQEQRIIDSGEKGGIEAPPLLEPLPQPRENRECRNDMPATGPVFPAESPVLAGSGVGIGRSKPGSPFQQRYRRRYAAKGRSAPERKSLSETKVHVARDKTRAAMPYGNVERVRRGDGSVGVKGPGGKSGLESARRNLHLAAPGHETVLSPKTQGNVRGSGCFSGSLLERKQTPHDGNKVWVKTVQHGKLRGRKDVAVKAPVIYYGRRLIGGEKARSGKPRGILMINPQRRIPQPPERLSLLLGHSFDAAQKSLGQPFDSLSRRVNRCRKSQQRHYNHPDIHRDEYIRKKYALFAQN